MTSLLHPPVFALTRTDGNALHFASAAGPTIEVFVLEDDIVRVRGRSHPGSTTCPWKVATGSICRVSHCPLSALSLAATTYRSKPRRSVSP